MQWKANATSYMNKSTYDRTFSVKRHLHLLHATTRRQQNLQVKQVGGKVTRVFCDVKPHPWEETFKRMSECDQNVDSKVFSVTASLYPCCWAIISKRDLVALLQGAETLKKIIIKTLIKCPKKCWEDCLPWSTSWSLSRDRTSGSQGFDSILDFSCWGTKGGGKRSNNRRLVGLLNALWSREPILPGNKRCLTPNRQLNFNTWS